MCCKSTALCDTPCKWSITGADSKAWQGQTNQKHYLHPAINIMSLIIRCFGHICEVPIGVPSIKKNTQRCSQKQIIQDNSRTTYSWNIYWKVKLALTINKQLELAKTLFMKGTKSFLTQTTGNKTKKLWGNLIPLGQFSCPCTEYALYSQSLAHCQQSAQQHHRC